MPDYIINPAKTDIPKDRPSLNPKIISSPNSGSPRVAGLAVPRMLNDAKFTGYEDLTVKLPMIKLSNEDLDNLTEPGLEYFADYGNSCGHRPTNVDAFGLRVSNAGDGAVLHEMICKNTGRKYSRLFKDNMWSDWDYAYTTGSPQTIPTSVDSASRLTVPRKINITGIATGTATFDGTTDVTIKLPFSTQLGNENGNVVFDGASFNFGGKSENNYIVFGQKAIGDREVPTDYYFGDGGTAGVRAGIFYIGNQDINNIFANIGHDHDDTYSKLGHSHEMGDLELPDKLPNPNGLLIKYNGVMYDTYTGEKAIEMNITPDGIGAANAEHGIHVQYGDLTPEPIYGNGKIGISDKVSRADHGHPMPPQVPEALYSINMRSDTQNMVGGAMPGSEYIGGKLGTGTPDSTKFPTTGVRVGILTMQPDTVGGAYQLGFGINANDAMKPLIGMRSNAIGSSEFGDWSILYSTTNRPTPADIGASPAGHTHNYAGSASVGGPANTANRWTTARTLSLTGAVTGSVSIDGSGNVSLNTSVNHNHDSLYTKPGHTHDDRYYTESEINTKLNGKANSSHTHAYLPTGGGTITGSLTVNGTTVDIMRALNKNGYPGMANGARDDTNWMRTTKNGLIPYQGGSASSLGTSSWRFSNLYADNHYEGTQLVHPPAVQSGAPVAKSGALWAW